MVKEELPNGNVASGQAWVINLRRPQFQDPRVREAIGLMFNFEWSNDTLFYGLYDPHRQLLGQQQAGRVGQAHAGELAILEPLAADLPPGVLTDDAVTAPVSGKRQLDRRNVARPRTCLRMRAGPFRPTPAMGCAATRRARPCASRS